MQVYDCMTYPPIVWETIEEPTSARTHAWIHQILLHGLECRNLELLLSRCANQSHVWSHPFRLGDTLELPHSQQPIQTSRHERVHVDVHSLQSSVSLRRLYAGPATATTQTATHRT